MVKEGLFERCPMDKVFGLHNWPKAPAGTFLWRVGPVMAAVGQIEITITGKGGHGASRITASIRSSSPARSSRALQTIVSRTIDATESGVVSIGHINGGHTHNVIPETVDMKGTARWFPPKVGDRLEDGVRRLATGIAESFGAKAELQY